MKMYKSMSAKKLVIWNARKWTFSRICFHKLIYTFRVYIKKQKCPAFVLNSMTVINDSTIQQRLCDNVMNGIIYQSPNLVSRRVRSFVGD